MGRICWAYRNLNLTSLNLGAHIRGRETLDGAAHGIAGAENLADGAGEILGKGAVANLAGNLNNLIESQVTVMLDVLLLLAITGGLLKSLDDVAGSGGLDLKGSNTVGNGQLDADTKTLVLLSLLGNIFLNLLGGLYITNRAD
jgi:hypothetical protein